jgi:hypothetical protein
MIHVVMEEARRLTAARTDIPRPGRAKPRLAAARAKLRLIEAKRQPAAPAPKSRTPRLDKARVIICAMQERMIADGTLYRQPEFDHRGRLIGHRIKSSVMDRGHFEPTPELARYLRLRLLESSSVRSEQRSIDARWSSRVP